MGIDCYTRHITTSGVEQYITLERAARRASVYARWYYMSFDERGLYMGVHD